MKNLYKCVNTGVFRIGPLKLSLAAAVMLLVLAGSLAAIASAAQENTLAPLRSAGVSGGRANAPSIPGSPQDSPSSGGETMNSGGGGAVGVGDSIMVAAKPLLEQIGFTNIDARVSRPPDEGIGVLKGMEQNGTLKGKEVLVGLGTNGPFSPQQIDEVLQIARQGGAKHVLLVNNYDQKLSFIDQNNANLKAAADGSGGFASLVDWHAEVAQDPSLLGPDGIHPSAAGQKAYADLVKSALGADPSSAANEASAPPRTGSETTTPSTDTTGSSADTTDPSSAGSETTDAYGSQPDPPSGLEGMVLGWFKSIMGFIYDSTVGDLLKKVSEGLQASVLGLPAPSGKIVDMYDGMVTAMRPVILVGILITALLMMLRTSSYDVAYASFSALPKFLGVAMAFAFLPEFMQILSKMTLDISEAFLPSMGRAQQADVELFSAAAKNMLGVGAMSDAGILNVIFAIMFVFVGFAVLLVAIVKNIMFQMLFIAGPFALAGSLIPGVQHLAASWFRGVMACAAVPIFWAIEIGVGTVIVSSPDIIFGQMTGVFESWSDGIFTMVGAIVILWLMYKTPFKVMEWAFQSYDGSRGPIRGFAKTVAAGLALGGIRKGLGALVGGAAGGGAGVAAGASAAGGTANTARSALSGSGPRGGLGLGKGMRSITGQSSSSGGSLGSGGRSSAGRELGGSRQGSLPERSPQQKALPAASPEVERKFLKQEGTSPGMNPKAGWNSQKRKQD